MKHKLQMVWHKLVGRFGKRWAMLLAAIPIAMAIGGGGTYAALYIGSSGQGDVNLQAGLVGHWKLDGSGVDSSSYGNNGTVTGASSTTDRKDTANGALSFNGTSSDYVTIGNPDELQITGSQTISMWLKPDTFDARRNPFAKAYGGEGTITQEMNGSLHYYYGTFGGNSTPYQNINTGTSLSLNTWTHVLIVRDLESMELTWYVNGSQTNQTTANYAAAAASSNSAFIGRGYVSNYSGSIDDVRIYDRAINEAEVQALYSQYNTKLGIASSEAGLIAHYKLDGNIKDSTPHAHNGTLVGSPSYVNDRTGSSNSALGISTNTQRIDDAGIDIGDEWTVSVWSPYPNNGLEETGHWRTLTRGNGGDHQIIVQSGGYVLGTYDNTDGTNFNACSPTFNVNSLSNGWHNFVVTQTGGTTGTMTFYVDGSEVCTVSGYGSVTGIDAVGNHIGGNQEWGTIDDFRVYDRALSSDEIGNLYTSYDSQIKLYGGGSSSGGSTGAGLVGSWPFSGNAKDATPYGNNGTVNGATLATNRFGQQNSAYEFDGEDDDINIGDAGSPQKFSFSFWINPYELNVDENNNYRHTITSSETGNFILLEQSGGISVRVPDVDTGWKGSAGSVALNNWSHVTVTYDQDYVITYVNGEEVKSTQIGSGTVNLGEIGLNKITAHNTFKGKIDDVRMYNRALSDSEVQQLYSSN